MSNCLSSFTVLRSKLFLHTHARTRSRMHAHAHPDPDEAHFHGLGVTDAVLERKRESAVREQSQHRVLCPTVVTERRVLILQS
jgi:hypothetical protein